MKQNYRVEFHHWPPRVRKPIVQVRHILGSDISEAISYAQKYLALGFDRYYTVYSATFTHWSKDKTCEVIRVVHDHHVKSFARALADHLEYNDIEAFDYKVMSDGSVCIEFHDISKGVIRISDTRDNPFGVKYKYNIIRDFPVSKTGWKRDGTQWRFYETCPLYINKPNFYWTTHKDILDKIVEQIDKK